MSLLEKALNSPRSKHLPVKTVSEEELELIIALLTDTLTAAQVATALNKGRNNVPHWLFPRLIRSIKDKRIIFSKP